MFDGILGRGFAPKGKSLIKLTKNRIDVLRRKRTATIKFLKKDLADLVSNGLDVNAYNRAGGLLDELRHLWNLDFVDSTGDFVYKNLITMQKMVECPEDCREAVSSLMFAASGFSELPELRELRNMFHEKYADSLGLFVNQELVESMSSKPYSLEKKLKLMEDVAKEFSIHWDSKAFEKRMVRHNSSSVKELHNYESPKTTYDKYRHVNENTALSKRKEFDLQSKEKLENQNIEVNFNRKMADVPQRRDLLIQPDKESYQNGVKGNQHGFISKERSESIRHVSRSESKDNEAKRKEPSRERHKPHFQEADSSEVNIQHKNLFQGNGHQNGVVEEDNKTEVIASEKSSSTKKANKLVIGFKQENFFQGYKHEKREETAPQQLEDNNTSKAPKLNKSKRAESTDIGYRHRDDQENSENTVLVEKSSVTHLSKNTEEDPPGASNIKVEPEVEKLKSSIYKSLPPPYVKPSGKPKNGKPETATVYSKAPGNSVHDGSFNLGSETAEKGNDPDIDKNVSGIENEPGHSQKRRSSRRKHTKQSSGDDISNMDRETRSRNSRRGLQVLIDDEKDSEEKMMDKLLMHYSKKPSSFEKSNMQQESKSRRSHVRKVKDKEGEEIVHRSLSLPSHHHQVAAEPSESSKTFARAASFQPDRSSPAKHVHPKLPDYDDLAARFAELKGR